VCAVDESLLYEDDPGQWTDLVALGVSAQIDAALGSEKSLSKVLQFAPQIAEQARNRAVFAMFLALVAIAAYIWIRFGNKDYGFAVIVALVHDVIITLGLIGVSHFVFQTSIAKALLIEDFKVDLPMVAAILTVIGYSMNDTIVVFDRIRENRGRAGSLNPNLINASINQTLSRTILTSLTSFFVVFVLYVFGGRGVHGFAVALMIGIVTGTYSTIAIASTLVYQPRLLGRIFLSIVCFGLLGMVMLVTADSTARLVLGGLVVVGCGMTALRGERRTAAAYAAARA
ncbi:MAG: protein translocase subunit SecF, partial [Planctomycetes bacterium]|nr:protein translocase subunit SecF [Planctomycetota bacterium]